MCPSHLLKNLNPKQPTAVQAYHQAASAAKAAKNKLQKAIDHSCTLQDKLDEAIQEGKRCQVAFWEANKVAEDLLAAANQAEEQQNQQLQQQRAAKLPTPPSYTILESRNTSLQSLPNSNLMY